MLESDSDRQVNFTPANITYIQ